MEVGADHEGGGGADVGWRMRRAGALREAWD